MKKVVVTTVLEVTDKEYALNFAKYEKNRTLAKEELITAYEHNGAIEVISATIEELK